MIVLQSVTVVAEESHKTIQSGIDHVENDHGHVSQLDNHTLQGVNTPSPFDEVESDCHHCCHSHTSTQLFTNMNIGFYPSILSHEVFEYTFKELSIFLLPNLRPPIV
jgi:hypothetical protein